MVSRQGRAALSAALLLSLLLTFVLAAPVLGAGKPTREPYPFEAYTLEAGEACDFPLLVEPLNSNTFILVFPPDADGTVREIGTGRVSARFTNLDTGASITRNVSGPLKATIYPDGSMTVVNLGVDVGWQLPAEGGPAAWIQYGRMVWEVDASDGLFILTEQHGRAVDLCAALG